MSHIYDALEAAEEETGKPRKQPARAAAGGGSARGIDKVMLNLYQNICSLLPDVNGRVVLFVGCSPSDGAVVLARQFARVVAFQMDRRVLLLDADRHHPTQAGAFHVQPKTSWEQAVEHGKLTKGVFAQVEESSLCVAQMCTPGSGTRPILDSPAMRKSLDEARKHFDLILIDTPPFSSSADGLTLSRQVDGVVVVVEAEKTRRQAAQQFANRMISSGGILLGVIFNKRRFPIPKLLLKLI